MPDLVALSRFMSYALRHAPEAAGLVLDNEGWADVADLVRGAQAAGVPLTDTLVQEIVRTNDKQRFRLSDDGRRIRASQGHSVAVDLKLQPLEPPETLFHGTATRFLASILADGLKPGSRQHVHLSDAVATATAVGKRHGRAVVLRVEAGAMYRDGVAFFRSDNGVWLTAHVPPRFLAISEP